MHISDATASTAPRQAAAPYRERLSPSLWMVVSAALAGPMLAVVFAPIGTLPAVAIGLAAALLVVVLLVAGSPVVTVADGELRVGRAHIGLDLLGTPVALEGEEARTARGPGLRRDAWHLLRGGIDGVVRVPVEDDRDPVGEWVFSSRTPERVVAAISLGRRTG
ncbi:DUF3093 domain-containing protein [Microbacterium sp. No. 7]|uniref:DUF3093 domain-containing protein n=1 Tax=Microbacterium sp. No. 7 TaxID=1714373 RepID=UPI0006D03F95|nr:DUF3093 domain-containing protein [Microbacterium sp. No. 7]ALJ20437.1 hypothetical protein AOA12_11180 [Microbacterium sp. No. 7]